MQIVTTEHHRKKHRIIAVAKQNFHQIQNSVLEAIGPVELINHLYI